MKLFFYYEATVLKIELKYPINKNRACLEKIFFKS